MPASLNQFVDILRRLSLRQQAVVIGGAITTLALIGSVVFYGSQPDYGVLFSDLKPADTQLIVDKLKAENVPYKLSGNGTSVIVPNDKIPELRLKIASTGGLSGGHVGFDIFDKNS